jgi:hypothetical protein
MGLVIDIVFMIRLLPENEIKCIMYETASLSHSVLISFTWRAQTKELCGFNINGFGWDAFVQVTVPQHILYSVNQCNLQNDQFEPSNITVWLQGSHFVSSSPCSECRPV